MNQKKDKKADKESQKLCGVGAYLKEERENRSLTHDQVAQITKLRPNILKAMENEDWDNLPQAVFVRGFVKSYAQALGLDERKALNLYENLHPPEPSVPKPIMGDKKAKKGRLLVVALLLGLIAAMVYLLNGHLFSEKAVMQIKETSLSESQEDGKHEAPGLTREEALSATTPIIYAHLDEKAKTEDSQGQQEIGPEKADESSFIYSPPNTTATTEWHVLKCFVKARTWLRIHIDDQSPKEFIFEPGSRPQWKAREGFNILIGNAAGVEFDFNGKKIANLGELGQVVRLRLPETYQTPISED
jgi:cytoskeletal protein RodZ